MCVAWDSIVGTETHYGPDGPGDQIPLRGGIFCTGPGAHQPPYSAKVIERVELYLFSPSGPSWPV